MSEIKMPEAIDLGQKLVLFEDHWTPKIVAQMNDYYIKLVKVEGEFVWHSHPETDELFYVVEGKMRIEFRDGSVELSKGELVVVPRGAEHKPVAESGCEIMLIEPTTTVNTGDARSKRTVDDLEWI